MGKTPDYDHPNTIMVGVSIYGHPIVLGKGDTWGVQYIRADMAAELAGRIEPDLSEIPVPNGEADDG